MYKHIVFDVDGTLINTAMHVKNLYQVLIYEEHGRYFTKEEMAKGWGLPTRTTLEIYGFKNIPEALRKYHIILMQAFQSANVYDGVLDTLDALRKRNITPDIVTARNKSEIEDDPAFGRIIHNFNIIICADDLKKYKPDPEPLLLCMEKANAKRENTIYIGDAYTDFLCAKAAGVDFGLATWGAASRDGIEAKYYFNCPDDITSILD